MPTSAAVPGRSPVPEGVGHRNQRADDRGHRGDEADEASRHRGVEEHDPDPDCDAAPRRPRGVRTRHTLGPDEKGGGDREAEPGELRESGDAHGADDTREDAAEEVGPADQERRGDGEERRHRRRSAIAVTTRDPRTSVSPPASGRRDPERLAVRRRHRDRSRPPTPRGHGVRFGGRGPVRASPLEKGPQALLALLARPPLRDPPGGLGTVGPLGDEPLRMPCRARACRAQLGQHSLERAAQVGVHLVHQPDPQGRRRVEALAGHEVPPRGALADLPQRERRDDGGDDPELHLGEREHRSGLGDRDVGAGDEPDAAAERVALDDGDDGCRTRVDRLEHAPERVRVGDVRFEVEVGRGAHPLDVRAGAEARPVPGEDDGPGGADVDEGLGELGDERGVERVARLRAGEGDAEDVLLSLDAERAHGRQPRSNI